MTISVLIIQHFLHTFCRRVCLFEESERTVAHVEDARTTTNWVIKLLQGTVYLLYDGVINHRGETKVYT